MNIFSKHFGYLIAFCVILVIAAFCADTRFPSKTSAASTTALSAANMETVEETVTLRNPSLSTGQHRYNWFANATLCGNTLFHVFSGDVGDDAPGSTVAGWEHYFDSGPSYLHFIPPGLSCAESAQLVFRGMVWFDLSDIVHKAPPLHVFVKSAALHFRKDRNCDDEELLIAQRDWLKGYPDLVPGDPFYKLPYSGSLGDPVNIDVTPVVNNWVKGEEHGGYPNYGFVFKGKFEEDRHDYENGTCFVRYYDINLTVTYKYDKTPVPSAPPAPVILAVLPPTRVASGITPSTPLAITSGVIGNINDDNPATTCEVQGVASTAFWFVLDLGSSQKISQVELLQWYETGSNDAGFTVQYSDSPLTGSNIGNSYGTSFSASTTPQNTSRTGSATARYWGLMRQGDFSSNKVGVASFNVYR